MDVDVDVDVNVDSDVEGHLELEEVFDMFFPTRGRVVGTTIRTGSSTQYTVSATRYSTS